MSQNEPIEISSNKKSSWKGNEVQRNNLSSGWMRYKKKHPELKLLSKEELETKRLQWQGKKFESWRKPIKEQKWKGTPEQNRKLSGNWSKFQKLHLDLNNLSETELEAYRLNYQEEMFVIWAINKTSWLGNSRQRLKIKKEWHEILKDDKSILNLPDNVYIEKCIGWQKDRILELEKEKENARNSRRRWLGNSTQRKYLPKLWKKKLEQNPEILKNSDYEIEKIRNKWQKEKIKEI